ncbi:MAG TPA: hypothetical protein VGK63_03295, partial [Candidatus Limnocylindrales bacterium]
LRAGRRARTWLPPRRPTLADAALDRAVALAVDGRGPRPLDRSSRPVLVVGAGSMGRLVAVAARGRGLDPLVASRTAARAAAVAAVAGGRPVALDPGPPILAQLSIGVVALSGPWTLGPESRAAILASGAPIIDLSSPPSVPAEVAVALGPRLVTIDDLAALPAIDPGLRSRLEDLVAWTLGEFDAWAARDDDRTLAAALADRAEDARTAELAALWQRMPDLDPGVRAEIERMAADLTGRLLRDPLERLGEDADGGRARLARELFRL